MSKLTGGVIAHCITAFFVCPKSQKGFTQRNCQNAWLVHSDSCGFRSSQLAINRIHSYNGYVYLHLDGTRNHENTPRVVIYGLLNLYTTIYDLLDTYLQTTVPFCV